MAGFKNFMGRFHRDAACALSFLPAAGLVKLGNYFFRSTNGNLETIMTSLGVGSAFYIGSTNSQDRLYNLSYVFASITPGILGTLYYFMRQFGVDADHCAYNLLWDGIKISSAFTAGRGALYIDDFIDRRRAVAAQQAQQNQPPQGQQTQPHP